MRYLYRYMKNHLFALSTLVVSLLLSSAAHAQTAAFTYQGQLNSSGALYTGSAEFQATLWNAATDKPVWSGTMELTEPRSVAAATETLAKGLITKMKADGVI